MNESIDYLKENIKKEEEIAADITALLEAYHSASLDERRFLDSSFKAYFNQLEILNSSIKRIVNDFSFDMKSAVKKVRENMGELLLLKALFLLINQIN